MTMFQHALLERLDRLIAAIEDNSQALREAAVNDVDWVDDTTQQEM